MALEKKEEEVDTPIVIVESPFAGDLTRNTQYLRAALADCLGRGEAPFASHALYTQPGVLDDNNPEERARGIAAGFAFHAVADKMVVYVDLGISSGMKAGIDNANKLSLPVEMRTLDGWESSSSATCSDQKAMP